MNYLYNMNVGDIVIARGGNIGYVYTIDYIKNSFGWTKVYDINKDVVPLNVTDVSADEIPRWFKQIGTMEIHPKPQKKKCADCNKDYDTDDRLDALNSNLLTLIEKLDQIINKD